MSDQPDELKEPNVAYGFNLPVAPGWFSDPARGTIEDGILLSLAALEQTKDRPEIFQQRKLLMCDVEFVW